MGPQCTDHSQVLLGLTAERQPRCLIANYSKPKDHQVRKLLSSFNHVSEQHVLKLNIFHRMDVDVIDISCKVLLRYCVEVLLRYCVKVLLRYLCGSAVAVFVWRCCCGIVWRCCCGIFVEVLLRYLCEGAVAVFVWRCCCGICVEVLRYSLMGSVILVNRVEIRTRAYRELQTAQKSSASFNVSQLTQCDGLTVENARLYF